MPPPLHCRVPSVKGKRLAAAKRFLRGSLCSVGTIDRAFSNRVAKGRVISARPGHGKFLPFHAKIRLVVSKGKPHARP
jgi:serine/threonine-protein kinase